MAAQGELRTDVLVIGGGLVGASAAFFLRRDHGVPVVLVERGLVGSQASGVNFGNVRRHGRHPTQLALAERSRAIWGELPKLIGADCEYAVTGHVRLASSDDDMQVLADWAEAARPHGVVPELIGRNTLRSRFPWLGRQFVGASVLPGDGQANPRLAAPAFGRAARGAGAIVVEQTRVLHLAPDGSGLVAELSDGRRVRARKVINAAGAWGPEFAGAAGEAVPLTPRGPQLGVTEPLPYRLREAFGTVSAGLYFRQVLRGNIVFGGGTRQPVTLEPPRARCAPEQFLAMLERLVRIIPDLAGAQAIRSWSGVEGYTPDMQPVLGPSRTMPGLVHAFGFSGHGFQMAPGVGATVAELAARGETAVPTAPFAPGRFASA
ncbi:NAD(P)/FAD-dependent oxidoreductase [Falsiroseomonas sp.]|uniref:NAD(P)/FAD-dependent oxidoreductase n=1 Tax=Falsiroseomonas sp. TaxID=2870721 RepID=UPI003568A3FC